VVCDEHGIDSDSEYCGDNDAQLGHIGVFYHGALSGECLPRAVLSDIGPGVVDAVRTSLLGELFYPEYIVNQNAGAGNNWAMAHCTWAGHEICLIFL
jgi:tubulin beta